MVWNERSRGFESCTRGDRNGNFGAKYIGIIQNTSMVQSNIIWDNTIEPPSVVEKPWGRFYQFNESSRCTVKIIEVSEGESISLQYHRNRDEVWVVLDPGLAVTVESDTWHASVNERIAIERGAKHRLTNTGSTGRPGRVLEISYGDFDEDDIVRLDDKYARPTVQQT